MSKPIVKVTLTTVSDGKRARVRALFDSGSFYTILRADKVPAGATWVRRARPVEFRTAARGGRLRAVGDVIVRIAIGGRTIEEPALISSELSQEMVIGAKAMQAWDITLRNRNGQTAISVGRHVLDPDVLEIDATDPTRRSVHRL